MGFCQWMKSKICAKVYMKKAKEKWWNDPERNKTPKKEIKYFEMSEFDSPDQIGSGKINMNMKFVQRLDQARESAGVPFKITSGFRSPEYHAELKKRGYHTSPSSEHLKGNAVDIATPDSVARYKILKSLMDVGFTRFGIGQTFIHVDCSTDKSQSVVWDYY